jgi:hypothetical protein
MKTTLKFSVLRGSLFAAAAFGMLLITGCSQEDVQTPADDQNLQLQSDQTRASGPSASGQGTLSFDGIPIEGEGFRHFSFQARERNNGTVGGNGVITYTGGVLKTHFDIDCLNVSGNVAIMSGVITKDKQNPNNEGLLFWFKVVDNGEGGNADADQMTLFFPGSNPDAFTCTINYGNALYDIEGGNIQVRE